MRTNEQTERQMIKLFAILQTCLKLTFHWSLQ